MASASASTIQKLIRNSSVVKRGAEHARHEIFGHAPQLNLPRAGTKNSKKIFTGPYLEKYYPTSINTFARKVSVFSSVSCPNKHLVIIATISQTDDCRYFC
jgi:hypothetical protein